MRLLAARGCPTWFASIGSPSSEQLPEPLSESTRPCEAVKPDADFPSAAAGRAGGVFRGRLVRPR